METYFVGTCTFVHHNLFIIPGTLYLEFLYKSQIFALKFI